jgi:histone deacetylase 11
LSFRIIYSPEYDISAFGLERLHAFDARKYGRAWALIREQLGSEACRIRIEPSAPVSDDDLRLVHTHAYLDSLASSSVVARALELRVAAMIPNRVLRAAVLEPMRWATAGTILATAHALESSSLVMNLGGGYHHAFRDRGEGFCLFADVAVAIAVQRREARIAADDAIAVIDLDAHRGNGLASITAADPAIHSYDMYNFQVYPGLIPDWIPETNPFSIPIRAGTQDAAYLGELRESLPRFLDSLGKPRVAIYNAGTDILAGDRLGGLRVSAAGVEERDRFVSDLLIERDIPTAIVTSGGYAAESHRLIADLAIYLARRCPSH